MEQWETGFQKLKAAYDAWNRTKGKSLDQWTKLMAPKCDFRSLAAGQRGVPWTKTRRSPSEVTEYLTGLTSTFKMKHYTVDNYVCQGDTIVSIGRTAWTCKTTGKLLDTPIVGVWRFKDGKAIGFFEYYDTAQVADAVTPRAVKPRRTSRSRTSTSRSGS
jgi:ketosteroid isomerase-like protein